MTDDDLTSILWQISPSFSSVICHRMKKWESLSILWQSVPSVPKRRTEGAKRGVKCALRPEFRDGGRSRAGGGGRTRTAVQTTHQVAFYMLIRPLVFVPGMRGGALIRVLSPKSWRRAGESLRASGLDDTPIAAHDRPEGQRDTRRRGSLGHAD